MKVLVYGAGAVGLGLGSCLMKAGAEVAIVARGDTVAALRKKGLVRTGIFGRYEARPEGFRAYESVGEIKGEQGAIEKVEIASWNPKDSRDFVLEISKKFLRASSSRQVGTPRNDVSESMRFDFILVCTKSFDSAAAAEELSKHKEIFGEDTKIVLCQNGWGNAEKFTVTFSERTSLQREGDYGIYTAKPNEVEITVHADAIHIGSLFGCDIACMESAGEGNCGRGNTVRNSRRY